MVEPGRRVAGGRAFVRAVAAVGPGSHARRRQDRIHRLGQYRPVQITRLIVENSIESRIVQLQEKKHLLFESTVRAALRGGVCVGRRTRLNLPFSGPTHSTPGPRSAWTSRRCRG